MVSYARKIWWFPLEISRWAGDLQGEPIQIFVESPSARKMRAVYEKVFHGQPYELTFASADTTSIDEIPDLYDMIIAGSTCTYTTFSKHTKLSIFLRHGCGLSNINREDARRRGLKVVQARGKIPDAVASYVFAQLDRFPPVKQAESKFGIFGVGPVARKIGEMAHKNGFLVRHAYFVREDLDRVREYPGVRCVSSRELLASSDIVCLALPEKSGTMHLINRTTLAHLKKTATLINVSRRDLVCYEDLLFHLNDHRLHSVISDFYPTSEQALQFLRQHRRSNTTNHVASRDPTFLHSTAESVARQALALLKSLERR